MDGYNKRPMHYFKLNNKFLLEWVAANCFDNEGNLKLPDDIYSWPLDERKAFIDGVLHGDGSKRASDGVYRRVCCENPIYAGGLQALIACTFGTLVNVVKDSRDKLWNIELGRNRQFAMIRKGAMNIIDYDGNVYCFEVPNHTLLTRRNGVPFISGNCHGDMVDAVSTIVARMLSEQLGYQDDMSVSNVAGTAQGGYNRTGLEASLMDQGDAYMREMGYF